MNRDPILWYGEPHFWHLNPSRLALDFDKRTWSAPFHKAAERSFRHRYGPLGYFGQVILGEIMQNDLISLDVDKINFDDKEPVKSLIITLLNVIEQLLQENQRLRVEIQQLRMRTLD
jgi:hypothetical protein